MLSPLVSRKLDQPNPPAALTASLQACQCQTLCGMSAVACKPAGKQGQLQGNLLPVAAALRWPTSRILKAESLGPHHLTHSLLAQHHGSYGAVKAGQGAG